MEVGTFAVKAGPVVVSGDTFGALARRLRI